MEIWHFINKLRWKVFPFKKSKKGRWSLHQASSRVFWFCILFFFFLKLNSFSSPHELILSVYQLNKLARSLTPTRGTSDERGSFHKTVSNVSSDWSIPSSRLHHSINSSKVTLPSLFLSINWNQKFWIKIVIIIPIE